MNNWPFQLRIAELQGKHYVNYVLRITNRGWWARRNGCLSHTNVC